MLERVFAARQEAIARAFEPVLTWCAGDASIKALDRALTEATHGYMGFLLDREAFVRLLVWEELAGGWRLRSAPRTSTAIHDAFGALRSIGNRRGLLAFDVDDAVLLFVSLAFAPLAHRSTLMVALDRDLAEQGVRRRHVRFVVAQLMHLLTGA